MKNKIKQIIIPIEYVFLYFLYLFASFALTVLPESRNFLDQRKPPEP